MAKWEWSDTLIKELFDYLLNLDKDSPWRWKLYLSMLRTNKENILQSSADVHAKLSKLVNIVLLDVGCADKSTVRRIISICCAGIFRFRNNPMSRVKMMNSAFNSGDVRLMKVLVKFGLVDRALKENAAEFKRAHWLIEEFRSFPVERDWLPINNSEEFFSNLNLIMDEMRRSCFQRNVFQRGVRRFLLLARLLDTFLIGNYESSCMERLVKCFKLFFTVLPDPFISLDELLTFLQVIFNQQMSIEGQTGIAAMYKKFYALEASLPYQPRTLKHLCRCSIRQVYRKRSRSLPRLIDRMKIPNTLKHFLLGDYEE